MLSQSKTGEMHGSWIWLAAHERKDNRRVFFRKEFVLDSAAVYGELLISALPFGHIFLNGEHVGYGPAPATHSVCYIDKLDVTQYLEPGINTIALIAMDQTEANWYAHPYPPRVWCQLSVDGKLVMATGGDWKAAEATAYFQNQPRCHFGMEETEKANLDHDLYFWTATGYDDASWQNAAEISPVGSGKPVPVLSKTPPCLWQESDAVEPLHTGIFKDVFACAYYSYEMFPEIKPGNYAAEMFALSEKDAEIDMEVSSDQPFVIFCNDDPVLYSYQTRKLDQYELPHSPQTGTEILQKTRIHIKPGWNRFLCFQEISDGGMGLMLLFPGTRKEELILRREPSEEALIGWNVCGPLRIPLSFSSPSFSTENCEDKVRGFLPLDEHINDISAYLGNCIFERSDTVFSDVLSQDEFAVYDLGEFCYGFPILDIEGSAGDIVDISCGLRLAGDGVRTIGPLGRMTDTLLLRDGNNSWMRTVPRGARYVMISVRRASGPVTPILRYVSATSELGMDSDFSCSDETLNQLWEHAMNSLRTCTGQSIADDPCGRRCQSLPEAYIYSRTLYSVADGLPTAAKALREFADAQLENGMMLKIAPSGVYSYSPDAALLWILWLEQHWEYTNDAELLREMMPRLDLLLKFFRMIPPQGDVLLPSERAGHCAFLNERRDLTEKGIFSLLNALYCRALTAAAHLYQTQENGEEKRLECLERAARLKNEINQFAFNRETGLYSDWYDGTQSAECSLRTNIMMLNAGIAEDEDRIRRILTQFCSEAEGLQSEISSAFLPFILETLFAYGLRETAYRTLISGFKLNLEKMYLYERKYNPHIFNIAAADFLIREFLGVRPSVPGAAQIYFNPACDIISEAHCKLPTAEGKIAVEWKTDKREIQVGIDSNCTLDVLPLIPPKFGATFNLGKHVNLLDPNSGKE